MLQNGPYLLWYIIVMMVSMMINWCFETVQLFHKAVLLQ